MSNVFYSLLGLNRFEEQQTYAFPKYYGKVGMFEDLDLSDRNSPHLSGMSVKGRLVKNDHSTVIPAGSALKWDTGKFGYGVVPAGALDTPCGVAPPYMPESIPVGAWFYMVVSGPTSVLKATDESVIEGERLVTAASGRADDEESGDYTNDKAEIGYALETSDTLAGTMMRVMVTIE